MNRLDLLEKIAKLSAEYMRRLQKVANGDKRSSSQISQTEQDNKGDNVIHDFLYFRRDF